MTMSATTYRNSPQAYGSVAKTLHWLTALLILTAIPLGLVAQNWPYDTSATLATKGLLFSLHKTVGLSAFFVGLARIAWALSQPKPGLLHPDRKLESWAAETVHWLLYASLVLVPLSGWLHHAATSGFAPIWWPFGQSLPFVPVNAHVAEFFGAWHLVFTKVLIATVLLHIAGALKHAVIDRDATLARMLPGRSAPELPAQLHSARPALAAFVIYAAALGLGSAIGLNSHHAAPQQTAESETRPEATTEGATSVAAGNWVVEQGSLGLAVTQFGSQVAGNFAVWNSEIQFDAEAPAAEKGTVRVEINIASLTLGTVTGEALKPEFFDAAAFPTALFNAVIVEAPEGAPNYLAEGTLELKGVTAPVTLPFTLSQTGTEATVQGSTVLDRREFNIGTTSYGDESTVAFAVGIDVSLTAKQAN